MKVMASADHHFKEGPRFEECIRIHDWMVSTARDLKPDVFVSCGDLYDAASTPNEREAVADFLQRMAETCIVYIVKGNHDRHNDCQLLARLNTRCSVYVQERCGVAYLMKPGGGDQFALAAVAWPSKASVAAMLAEAGKTLTPDALEDATKAALKDILRGLGVQLRAFDGPRLLAMHAQVGAARSSVGQPLIGASLALGLEDLAEAGADLTLLGHIHKPQEWAFDGRPILYTGSPFRQDYGELEEKSVVFAEVVRGAPVAWRRIPTPARAMHHVELEEDGGLLCDDVGPYEPEGACVEDADLRLRFGFDPDRRAQVMAQAEAIKARWLAGGAHDVKLEPVPRVTTRARLPEITTAVSPAEKLAAYWASQGEESPPPSRQVRILSKLSTLLEEGAS